MPKVKLKTNAGDYIQSDFSNFIKKKRITQKEISEWLNISQPAVSYKLKNDKWDIKDFYLITKGSEASDQEILNLLKGRINA